MGFRFPGSAIRRGGTSEWADISWNRGRFDWADAVSDTSATVLIIDDEESLRKCMAAFLEDRNFRVVMARDGVEGLDLFERERPDIVLTDLRMPDVDGLEVLLRVREISPEIPLIVVSGTDRIDDSVEALRLGASDYILKPIEDMSVLIRAIENALERARLLRDNREYQEQLEEKVGERTAQLEAAIARLRVSEKRFRDLAGALPEAIFESDASMNLTYANEKAFEIFGYSQADLDGGVNGIDMLAPSERSAALEDAAKRARGVALPKVEYLGLRSDGATFPALFDISPVFDGDKLTGFRGVIADISACRHAEARERELAQKLADAERIESLAVLAGGVAHDLNNMLGPLVLLPEGIGEVLRNARHASDEAIADARQDLAMLTDAAERAAATVQELQTLGRRGDLDFEPLDTGELVRDCLESHDVQTARLKHARVQLDAGFPQQPLMVMGNATALHRVLLNLLLNAMEAIPRQGAVRVDVERIEIAEPRVGRDVIAPGDYVRIRVRDSGVGIPDAILRKLFEPFVSSKKGLGERSGSGLGLSVVHAVVRDHHGCIDVEGDMEGWTTTFSVYLPAVAAPVRQGAASTALPPGTEHILIVDDEPAQRFIARRCLKRLGYTLAEAVNGRHAIRLCREMHDRFRGEADPIISGPVFDLVLIDMVMKGDLDGLDTLQAVRVINPSQKAIIVSGHAPEARGAATVGLGATWLAKPYTSAQLASAVRQKLAETNGHCRMVM